MKVSKFGKGKTLGSDKSKADNKEKKELGISMPVFALVFGVSMVIIGILIEMGVI